MMLTSQGTLARRRAGGLSLPRLGAGQKAWFAAAEFADLAAIADFNGDRYAVPALAMGSVASATAAELCVKRAAGFSDWFAFTAASTTARSYLDAAGLIRSDLAADQPRPSWLNGRRQLALNDQATNLLLWSGDLGNAAWTPSGVSVSAVAGAAPDGGPAHAVLPGASASTFKEMQQNVAATSGQSYCFSCFARANGYRYVQLVGTGSVMGTFKVNIDLQTGAETDYAAGTATNVARGIIAYPNGWYRLWISLQALSSSSSARLGVDIIPAATSARGVSWSGDGTSSVLIWGQQIETGAIPTPYVATTNATVTRAIESARFSPLLEAVLQRPAASVVVRGQAMTRASGRIVGASGGALVAASSGLTQIVQEGSATLATAAGGALSSGNWGAGASFDAAGRSVARNGATAASDSGTPVARSTIHLGRGASGAYGDGFYDWVGIAPSRLSEARLNELCSRS
jgi:hypothetical protein